MTDFGQANLFVICMQVCSLLNITSVIKLEK